MLVLNLIVHTLVLDTTIPYRHVFFPLAPASICFPRVSHRWGVSSLLLSGWAGEPVRDSRRFGVA